MGKLIIVENDKVEGTDKHNVKGTGPVPPPTNTGPYAGIGNFDYVGKMTDQLSDFVKIDDQPISLKNSKSSLNPGESTPPAGKHSGPMGKQFVPGPDTTASTPTPATLSITDTIGTGIPSATSGSSFVTSNGVKVLLDGDKIDTCDGTGRTMNSTVTSQNQSFVSCSE